MVPIRHIFRTNIKYARSQITYSIHAYSSPTKSAAFCTRFQFFTVLPLSSVTIKYQFSTTVIIWYQIFMCMRIWYQFCTRVIFIPIFTCDDLIPIFTGMRIWYRFFTCVRIRYRFFTFVKNWYKFFKSEKNSTSSLQVRKYKTWNLSTNCSPLKLSKLTLR